MERANERKPRAAPPSSGPGQGPLDKESEMAALTHMEGTALKRLIKTEGVRIHWVRTSSSEAAALGRLVKKGFCRKVEVGNSLHWELAI